MSSNSQGRAVFVKDVNETYARISKRSKELAAETEAEAPGQSAETIQLVATDESGTITFDVPDGPPPEHITLEGEGTEDLDVEEVKAFLQKRWEIFESFPKNFKKALQENKLDAVNKALAKMTLEDAEEAVSLLQQARILNFGQEGIVDQTGGSEGAGQPGELVADDLD